MARFLSNQCSNVQKGHTFNDLTHLTINGEFECVFKDNIIVSAIYNEKREKERVDRLFDRFQQRSCHQSTTGMVITRVITGF